MAINSFEDLIEHVGHETEIVTYGPTNDRWNVAIECLDCSMVLVCYDNPEVIP